MVGAAKHGVAIGQPAPVMRVTRPSDAGSEGGMSDYMGPMTPRTGETTMTWMMMIDY